MLFDNSEFGESATFCNAKTLTLISYWHHSIEGKVSSRFSFSNALFAKLHRAFSSNYILLGELSPFALNSYIHTLNTESRSGSSRYTIYINSDFV
jgi:hypothetical protein